MIGALTSCSLACKIQMMIFSIKLIHKILLMDEKLDMKKGKRLEQERYYAN